MRRIDLPYHAGLIVASDSPDIVQARLDAYATRFLEDFYATAPVPDKAMH